MSEVRIENQTKEAIKRHSVTAILSVALISAAFFVSGDGSQPIDLPSTEAQTAALVSAFDTVEVEARAAYVYDVTQAKTLFAKNEAEILPLASLTKIMTAITAANEAPDTTIVTVGDGALRAYGNSGLLPNEEWMLSSLIKFMLVSSSNDAAVALSTSLGSRENFIKKMNERSVELGLGDFEFYNETGLDVTQLASGGYGSAKSVALLMAHAAANYRDLFEPTRYPVLNILSESGVMHFATNTDKIVDRIPGIVGGKTGYTLLAGGNLAVILEVAEGHSIVVVVLGSSQEGRFTDVEKLVKIALEEV